VEEPVVAAAVRRRERHRRRRRGRRRRVKVGETFPPTFSLGLFQF
jgi:hypothetical protein